jgi:hypothetical protein
MPFLVLNVSQELHPFVFFHVHVLLNQIFGGITSPVYIYIFLVRLGVLQAILLIMATLSYGF